MRKINASLTTEYLDRVKKVCKIELTSKHLFKAMNTLATPVLTYSFGVMAWTDTDLESIRRKTRIALTKHQKYNHKSSVLRMTMTRREGVTHKDLHNGHTTLLTKYFLKKRKFTVTTKYLSK